MDNVLLGNLEEESMRKILISANVLFTIANFRKDLIKFLKDQNFEVICIASEDSLSSNAKLILDELGAKFINIEVSR